MISFEEEKTFVNKIWEGWKQFREPIPTEEYWDEMFSYFSTLNTDKEKGQIIQAILNILEERGRNG